MCAASCVAVSKYPSVRDDVRWRHRQQEQMGFAGGIKHNTFPLSIGAIRPNTGADDTCTSGMATYSEDSEYMAVLTHRVVSHEEITCESLIIKVT